MLSAIHCSTSGDDSRKFCGLSFFYSIQDRNSSHARQPLSRVNVTWLLRRLHVKIENIYLFKTMIKKTWKRPFLKTGFAQIFSCWPKNLSCPKFGGAAFPLAPRPVRLCAPWITKKLIALCKEERSLYKPRRSNKTTIWEKHQRVSEQFCKDTLQNSSMGIHWKTSLRSEKKMKTQTLLEFC